MDLVNVVNEGTYNKINTSGRCRLCIVKCASFVFSCFILCSPAGNYMFKVNNRNSRTKCAICSKVTIKTAERRQLYVGKCLLGCEVNVLPKLNITTKTDIRKIILFYVFCETVMNIKYIFFFNCVTIN